MIVKKQALKAIFGSLIATIILVLILGYGEEDYYKPTNMVLVSLYFVAMTYAFYKTSVEKKDERQEKMLK